MSTDPKADVGFPEESFVNVGSSLDDDVPNLPKEEEEKAKSNIQPGEKNRTGVLIVDEGSANSDPVSEISINTLDIDAANEIQDLEIARKNKIIYGLSVICFTLVCLLCQSWKNATAEEKELLSQCDRLESELNQLKFDYAMMKPDKALFEVDNCYFNIRTSGRLGECAEDLSQSAYDWYDWSINNLNSFVEGALNDVNEDLSSQNSSDPDIMSKLYSDWLDNIADVLNWKWDDGTTGIQ